MKTDSPPAPSLPEALARSIRHEVGDLLQTVYATVAILQKRLPENCNLERRLLADMRARAETCKNRLDTVHDLVCPLSYAHQPVDLAELASALVNETAARHQLEIKAEATAKPVVLADVSRLAQLGGILLANACEAARTRVLFRTKQGPASGEGEWEITDDGPGVAPELMPRLFVPFFTTRHGHAGIGLALAEKLVAAHGGCITAENQPPSGFLVRVILPATPPEPKKRGQDP